MNSRIDSIVIWMIKLVVVVALTTTASSPVDSQLICAEDGEVNVHCGRTPTPIVDPRGQLLIVFVQGEHVYLTTSNDFGHSFSSPVQVNSQLEKIYANGENRPKIALGTNGEIFISWSKVTKGRFNGDIRFTRSLDAGVTFEPVRTVNDDGLLTTHRFEVMQIADNGNLFLAWIDKRDKDAAIYAAVSLDNGLSFEPNFRVAARSCQCCRLAAAPAEDGVALFWRHIFDQNTRDHAFSIVGESDNKPEFSQATVDDWKIDACPHHGPAMAVADSGDDRVHHVTWFTAGAKRQGIFYGYIDAATRNATGIREISTAPSASHPHILVDVDTSIWIVWKEFDGTTTHVYSSTSRNSGKDWEVRKLQASTGNNSDHPLLINSKEGVLLSWLTEDEGYRLIPLRSVK
ncbi:MAG: exo-alpha-sialidase [Gammaproteobacteria bacterium]|nr:exo-alpha-sialidase [Gammaproteobacteria bacterium]